MPITNKKPNLDKIEAKPIKKVRFEDQINITVKQEKST